jgi:hypothetical protein
MKFVTIVRLAPGVESVQQAFEVFGKVGPIDGTQQLYAASDGKTFITVTETDSVDITGGATYAPFFESSTTYPVVEVDDAWVEAVGTAITNQG